MKKIRMAVVLLCCVLGFSSCASDAIRSSFFAQDEREIILPYFEAFIGGVNAHDAEAIRALFASPIKDDDALSGQIEAAFDFLSTPLTIADSPTGCHSSSHFSGELRYTEINEIFTVECSGQTYYAAMKICSEDSTNSENVGIMSVYFIRAQDYDSDVFYRGDGKWTPGINLESFGSGDSHSQQ